MTTALPINHYRHLARLAGLRRCSISDALTYLINHVDPMENDWLDERFGISPVEKALELQGHPLDLVLRKIQGLPRNIRPETDGPYLDTFEFFHQGQGLLGIIADGVRMLDFEMATHRDTGVFALVRDLLPMMTPEQYRLYNTFNSQYLRQVRAPELMTMPRVPAMAIDAGCYVGYKAAALARFTGGAPVLAFELATENYEVLKLNADNNPQLRIQPIRAALSDRRTTQIIHTRNPRTMAHSLTDFGKLAEANTSMAGRSAELSGEEIQCEYLDDYTKNERRLSAVHISVNGHEPEVIRGGFATARKADILRVSCPYNRDGRPVREMVIEALDESGVNVFGQSGGAIIAGTKLGDYHLNARPASKLKKLPRKLIKQALSVFRR